MRRNSAILGVLVVAAAAVALLASEVLSDNESAGKPPPSSLARRTTTPDDLEPAAEDDFVPEPMDPPPSPAEEARLASQREQILREKQQREKQLIEALRKPADRRNGAELLVLRDPRRPGGSPLMRMAGQPGDLRPNLSENTPMLSLFLPQSAYISALSPDSQTLAVSNGSSLYLRNLYDNKTASLTKESEKVTALAFSPDGATLAFGFQEGAVRFWNVKKGQPGETGTAFAELGALVSVLAWSPDGKTLAIGTAWKEESGQLTLWDVATGRELQKRLGRDLRPLRSAEWSADGKLLVSLGLDSRWLQFWDPVTGEEKRGPKRIPATRTFALSPDGKTVAAAATELKLYDVRTREKLGTLNRDGMNVQGLAFSPDGKLLMGKMGRPNRPEVRTRVWDLASGKEAKTPRQLPLRASPFATQSFSPGGLLLISADWSARIFDANELLNPPAEKAALEELLAELEQFVRVKETAEGFEVEPARVLTDDDLLVVRKLPRVCSINLRWEEQITDAGLAHLAGMTELRRLNLIKTQVTDEGLKSLQNMKQLTNLLLSDTKVTGEGLVRLKALSKLSALSLSGPNIGDAELEHLAELKSLGTLYLFKTSVTPGGIARLKKSFVKLNVVGK